MRPLCAKHTPTENGQNVWSYLENWFCNHANEKQLRMRNGMSVNNWLTCASTWNKELPGEQKWRNQQQKTDMPATYVHSPVNGRTSCNKRNESICTRTMRVQKPCLLVRLWRQTVFTFLSTKRSDHYRTVCSYKTRSVTNWRDSNFPTFLILQGQPVSKIITDYRYNYDKSNINSKAFRLLNRSRHMYIIIMWF
jgi:hypothetical protein